VKLLTFESSLFGVLTVPKLSFDNFIFKGVKGVTDKWDPTVELLFLLLTPEIYFVLIAFMYSIGDFECFIIYCGFAESYFIGLLF
jgi:hypothetical protein